MDHHLFRRSSRNASPTLANPPARVEGSAATGIRVVSALIVLAAGLLAAAPVQAAPGDLDPTFSDDGKQLTAIAVSEAANDMLLQADGKMLVVGESYYGAGGTYRSSLTRFNPDGSLDTSFARDGRLMTEFGNVAGAVALQPDDTGAKIDKIVAGGGQTVARYLPDGSPDNSFGVSGKVTTDFGISDVQVQPDGRIVVAGYGGTLARYNLDGSLDTSFGVNGRVTTGFNTSSIALQPPPADGPDRIVAVGSTAGSDGDSDVALARYNADGSLDTSFDGGGKQIIGMWGSDEGLADVTIGPDGTIAAVGQSYCFTCSSTMLVLAVFARNGSGGLRLTDASGLDTGSGVAVQSDGKIVAVGGSAEDFLVARYDSGGNPDPSFHDDGVYTDLGVRTTDFGGSDGAGGVALLPDGKIVAAGTSYTYAADGFATGRIALARYEGGSVSGTAPVTSSLPTISGIAAEGQTLTASAGAWTGTTPLNRSYQWRRCDSAGANCLDITAASATTYSVAAADIGHTIRVRETATNAYGQGFADSVATALAKGNPPVNSAPPTISGMATGGQTLRLYPGIWTGTAPISRSYQWRRCDPSGTNCVDIAAASTPSYVLVAADVDHTIRARETATNVYGQSSVESAASALIKAKPGTIAGTVRNQKSGAAIANATVNCTSGYSAKTSSTGNYSIPNVPPGSHSCTASASGYRPSTRNVAVSAGQTSTADFSFARQ